MLDKKWFRVLITLILVFLLIYLVSLVDFIFDPIWKYLAAIALPIIAAGLLFYITNPVVHLLERIKIPRVPAILIVFLLIIGIFYLISIYIAPIVQRQFSTLIENAPQMAETVQGWISYWQNNRSALPAQLNDSINNFANNLGVYTDRLTSWLVSFISGLFSFLFSFVLIPFFLFFMLKDGHRLIPYLTQFLSHEKAGSFRNLMQSVNNTLQTFILGQFLVSCFVGTFLYIGYQIIGLPYSMSLALVALVLNVIPFAGPFLAAIPAILVAFLQSPTTAVWVILVMVIVQQLEGNLISPNVIGKVLHLHPLTIITLILAAGSIAGFLGLVFVIPFYAVVKTIISHFYKEWQADQPIGEKEIL